MTSMVDFLRTLSSIESQDTAIGQYLTSWNDDIEDHIRKNAHQQGGNDVGADQNTDQLLSNTSCSLHSCLIRVLNGDNLQIATAKAWKDVKSTALEALTTEWNDDMINSMSDLSWSELSVVIRTSKNWWRLYMQLQLQENYTIETRSNIEKPWRSRDILQLLVRLMETFHNHGSNGSQYSTQLFFYITFPQFGHDATLYDSYNFVITECKFLERLLKLLIRNNIGVLLKLSIVRNIHNALVSFPALTTSIVNSTVIDLTLTEWTVATWVQQSEEVTYINILRDLALFTVSDEDQCIEAMELIIEIFRCCYALRIRSEVESNDRWHMLIETILALDSSKDRMCHDCQFSIVPILMDASTNFRIRLSSVSIKSLLNVLDKQVTIVINEQLIDDRAAAALNPILAVLYKLCMDQPNGFYDIIREVVFPNIIDMNSDSDANEEKGPTKNMSPIDAPIGSLRWKLIQLLTWPNGFVKRLSGELLFLLCHNQEQEFIRRVGMGNAVTLLSLKGLLDLPESILD